MSPRARLRVTRDAGSWSIPTRRHLPVAELALGPTARPRRPAPPGSRPGRRHDQDRRATGNGRRASGAMQRHPDRRTSGPASIGHQDLLADRNRARRVFPSRPGSANKADEGEQGGIAVISHRTSRGRGRERHGPLRGRRPEGRSAGGRCHHFAPIGDPPPGCAGPWSSLR